MCKLEANVSRDIISQIMNAQDPYIRGASDDSFGSVAESLRENGSNFYPLASTLGRPALTPGKSPPPPPITNSEEDIKPSLNSSLDIVGHRVKALMQAIQALRHLGVEDLILPLPKIAVIGDQSTGKSSLIEAISEIKVPRDVGTCTRCPLEINLSEGRAGSAWKCKVSLVQKFTYDPTPHHSRRNASQPFGPWVEKQHEIFLFCELDDKNAMEGVIHRAQLATLNPSQPYHRYIPGSPTIDDTFQVKFSPNVVQLEVCASMIEVTSNTDLSKISGPGLPELAFYDLPGVITNPETEDEMYLVELVKALAKAYISPPNTLVLWAVPMTDDAANSSSSRLISEMKAQGRTIGMFANNPSHKYLTKLGVLTKPDRLQRGERYDQWIKMLRNENHKVGHGYFVTKQPAQESLNQNIDHAQARQDEMQFFATQEPWTTSFAPFCNQFGTRRLQDALSQKLTVQIRSSLGTIKDQVTMKAHQIDAELKLIPEPTNDNPAHSVNQTLDNLIAQVRLHIDGGDHNNLRNCWRDMAMGFRHTIDGLAPKVKIADRSVKEEAAPITPNRPINRKNLIVIGDEDDLSPIPETPGSRKRPSTAFHPTSREVKRNRNLGKDTTEPKISYTLGEIEEILKSFRTSDIYVQAEPKAIDHLIKLSLEPWEKPTLALLAATFGLLKEQFAKIVATVYSTSSKTEFYQQSTEIINNFLDDTCQEQRESLSKILRLEKEKPYTSNEDMLCNYKNEELERLTKCRQKWRTEAKLREELGQRMMTEADKCKFMSKISGELPTDPFMEQMIAISSVKAYYRRVSSDSPHCFCANVIMVHRVATSRFADNVAISIQNDLFVTSRDRLSLVMKQQLGLLQNNINERCAMLLVEDPAQELRRNKLKQEKEKLAEAQNCLTQLARERSQTPEPR
ncbi:MAG: hypothetical protein M1829_000872 [Trizodia sp. TS-e1964]|nr:MAG: hypothetical protein M1829_000872 [Trizodia sp. TS-e1964]